MKKATSCEVAFETQKKLQVHLDEIIDISVLLFQTAFYDKENLKKVSGLLSASTLIIEKIREILKREEIEGKHMELEALINELILLMDSFK
ncbi:hypothetical protein [Pedobacter nutrimenti]|uniref:hypothetical protein n=1 Tax=Pedobacter nutrimenti TaxID=1241337 RepID=UPI00292E470A|nr:hypothetical protein [Pedobacter nutrimenti]